MLQGQRNRPARRKISLDSVVALQCSTWCAPGYLPAGLLEALQRRQLGCCASGRQLANRKTKSIHWRPQSNETPTVACEVWAARAKLSCEKNWPPHYHAMVTGHGLNPGSLTVQAARLAHCRVTTRPRSIREARTALTIFLQPRCGSPRLWLTAILRSRALRDQLGQPRGPRCSGVGVVAFA